jgi:raffinose/stachyose/melibiose transport system permease protein
MVKSTIYKRRFPLVVFLTPAFAFLALFLFYPFVRNIINSFYEIKGLGTPAKRMQEPLFANYEALVSDPNMITAFKNTMILMGTTIVFQVGIALILALLIDRISKGAGFFRTVYFFPIVISATALGLLFNLIFLYDGGMINQVLQGAFGFTENIDFKDEEHFMFTMLFPVMWQYIGFYFVIIVTGLNNIPSDIYEAARIDGAKGLRLVRFITMPLIYNVLCTCLVLAVTGALKVFDLPWVMMGTGMPLDKSWLTGTYMYHNTMNRGDVDYASTISIAIVVIGVTASLIVNKVFKEKDY